MIALDTNVLVHAHRVDSTFHHQAKRVVTELAQRPTRWAIPYPCFIEFFGIVTNARIWRHPSTATESTDQLRAWMESPSLVLLTDEVGQLEDLFRLLCERSIAGARVHDARIAAVCLAHGVSELWTVDRDFSRFAQLSTRNPL